MDWRISDCYIFDIMVDTIPQMFHTASNWLTLGKKWDLRGRVNLYTYIKLNVMSEICYSC